MSKNKLNAELIQRDLKHPNILWSCQYKHLGHCSATLITLQEKGLQTAIFANPKKTC